MKLIFIVKYKSIIAQNTMHFSKIASFSPNNKYFACISADNKLLVWETSNAISIDCNFNANVHSSCTSLNWFQTQHKYASPKKAKLLCNSSSGNILLAIGTLKGDILLYNVTEKNLYMHLARRHTDAVNDISFYNETNSLFSCSSDKSIAIWDFSSGKQKSKWEADDRPVSSICVIDENNLLSASSSILWWNVSEKTILKKFIGHSAEIFKLLPVNSVSLNSCYFLSAAVNDIKINAWSSNKSETPVASFVLPTQPENIDISKVFSKDKPLILSVVTKNGFLHLFEHVLNGTVNQPIMPKASIQITAEISESLVISTRLFADSESCIVAYGTSQSNMTFKHIKIREALDKSDMQNSTSDKDSLDKSLVVKERSKSVKVPPINGVKSASNSGNSSKSTDSAISNYKRKLRSSSCVGLTTESKILDIRKIEDSNVENKQLDMLEEKELSPTEILLKGLQTGDDDVIDTVLYNAEEVEDFISDSIKNFPVSCLKDFLCRLSHRLEHQQKHSYILRQWFKEILTVHLSYLIQCQETEETFRHIRRYLNSLKIHETVSKLSVLKGFLNFQIQNSDESDSENEEIMES